MLIRRKKEVKVEDGGKKFEGAIKTEMKKIGKGYVDLMKESTKGLVDFK
jgi:hypothetical protein